MNTPTLLDMIHQLTQPHTCHEPYWLSNTGRTHHHATKNPPLITQLYDAVQPSSAIETGITPPTSRPGARIDAIDAARRIDTQAVNWLNTIGFIRYGNLLHHRPVDNTITAIAIVAGLAPLQDHCARAKPERDDLTHKITCCTTHRIEADIERWWTWARITTGWDQPAWQPDNTCPACGTRGTIRVHRVDHIATCTNDTCRATWNRATIGLLADHIRTENGEGKAS